MTTLQVDPTGLALLALAGAVAVVLGVYGLAELRLAARVLRSEPDSVLETPRGGHVELRGTARPVNERRVLRSPFTDTPCLVCEYAVEEEHDTRNGRTWTTVDSGSEYVPFRLEDGSGSVLIEPPGANLRLETDTRIDVDGGTKPPRTIARYIDETDAVDDQERTVDLRLFELRTGKDRRFRERLLEPGDTVHVLGTARYDTTVSRDAGQVNAAVGIDERALSPSSWIRLRHRLVGDPFVITDSTERRLGVRALAYGLGSLVVALAIVGLTAAWVV